MSTDPGSGRNASLRLPRRSLRLCGGRPVSVSALLLFSVFYFLISGLAGCGYRVAGRGSRLPESVHTIAVPALENRTSRYRIEQRLTEALVRELLARTKYRVVQDESTADAILRGEVTSIDSRAVLFDSATGRATTLNVTVILKVRLLERSSQKVLYGNDNFLFREQYEVSTEVASFFEEQDPALERLTRDFAARLVAALLENF